MVAFNKDNIPATVTTVEQLFSWASGILEFNAGRQTVVEDIGELETRVVQEFIIQSDDGTIRSISRLSLPVNKDYKTNSGKFWESIQEISTSEIPDAFLVG